jgi:hypothetical protein
MIFPVLSSSVSEERIDLGPHGFIHLDQRRPRMFEAFAGQFLRRVNAEFAALPREIIPV